MPGRRSIDHPVVAVRDLDRAAEEWRALGFTLTPRAHHADHMGTCNHVVQFRNRAFIEILEVDRPERMTAHAPEESPPRFSFGAHHHAFLGNGPGLSMLALTTADARADLEELRQRGLHTYAPFDFERRTTLPDGSEATVGFSLGFVTSPRFAGNAFFLCQHRAPQHFWRESYQTHANGALSLDAIYVVSERPEDDAAFLSVLTGGTVHPADGGYRVDCGEQELIVATAACLARLAPDVTTSRPESPRLAGLAIGVPDPPSAPVVVSGTFIAWRLAAVSGRSETR